MSVGALVKALCSDPVQVRWLLMHGNCPKAGVARDDAHGKGGDRFMNQVRNMDGGQKVLAVAVDPTKEGSHHEPWSLP